MEQNNQSPETNADILFENHYTRTERELKEIFQYSCFFRPSRIVLYIFMAFCFGLCALNAALYQRFSLLFMMLFLIPFYMVLNYILYRYQVNLSARREAEASGGQAPEIIIAVTNERVILSGSQRSKIEVEWFHFKRKVTETKHLLMLTSNARLLYVFRKDSFTKGDIEDFKDLLVAKGFKVKS